MSRTGNLVLSSTLFVWLAAAGCAANVERRAALSDEEFWNLTTSLSEPPGVFSQSDNLVSNETHFVDLARLLRRGSGVYVGVGPEQNFSYIARARPTMAFVIDVRSENRALHLLYKALFEMSADRADLVGRLFSRARPADLDRDSAVAEIFSRYREARGSEELRDATSRLVREQLLETHAFPLAPDDLAWIDHVLNAFYTDGPAIHYWRARRGGAPGPSYEKLMTSTDLYGQPRSYLATEEGFAFVKDLQSRNMLVPIVGNFAGPYALRRIGEYVRQRGEEVDTFYSSNVEVYLDREARTGFCNSLAALPFGSGAAFVNNRTVRPLRFKLAACR